MSPLTINTDNESEHGMTPPQQDGPIITRAADIFTLPNEDSDQELDREVELINIMSSYINRNRLALQINGVYIFPQKVMYTISNGKNTQTSHAQIIA